MAYNYSATSIFAIYNYIFTKYRMAKGPMTEEQKAALKARLAAGRDKRKAAREEAKKNGQPDPYPRKKRAKKGAAPELAVDPTAHPPANETIRGIDQATKDGVAAVPVDALLSKTTPIDVPNLPADVKDVVVKKTAAAPEAKGAKGVSTSGKPKKVEVVEDLTNSNTGDMVVPAQYPDQIASVKKLLKKNKSIETPDTVVNKLNPKPADPTTSDRSKHVPDMKATTGREPFSFQAMRKLLGQ